MILKYDSTYFTIKYQIIPKLLYSELPMIYFTKKAIQILKNILKT